MLAFYSLWAFCIAIPILLWLKNTGSPVAYISDGLPPGQTWYVFSKLLGLLSAFLLLLHIGLILSKKHWRRHWDVNAHKWLGLSILVLAALHVGCFVTAKSVRGGGFAYDTLMPSFTHGYYKSMVSLGSIVFFLLVVTAFSGFLRKTSLSKYSFKFTHKAGVLGFLLLFFHFSGIGSDLAF